MMGDIKNLIERFFDKDLNQQEREAFQQRLQEDASFALAFETEKDLMEGIESLGNDRLRKELQQIHQEEIVDRSAVPKVRSLPLARRWWMAAAALFIGLALTWWLWPVASPDTQQLYAQYAQHDFYFTEKSSSVDLEKKLLVQIENNFKKKQYEAALIPLHQYLKLRPNHQEVLLAKGAALVELEKDYPTARSIFQSLANSNSLLANDGVWYLALLELRQGNRMACRKALHLIPADSARYSKAQALLKHISSWIN